LRLKKGQGTAAYTAHSHRRYIPVFAIRTAHSREGGNPESGEFKFKKTDPAFALIPENSP
jgi:hypothetical protein